MGEAKEACGVVAVYDHRHAPYLTYLGLTRLDHRGQEGCGIVAREDGKWASKYKLESVITALTKDDFFPSHNGNGKSLHGDCAIGHTRYSTTGSSDYANLQPILRKTKYGTLAIAHNGNLTNAMLYRQRLEQEGHIFHGNSDTEVILQMITTSGEDNLEGAIVKALRQLEGSFSLAIMSDNALYAARDKYQFKPLTIGKLDGSFVVASETCALHIMKATIDRDVRPGELVIVDNETLKTHPGYRVRQFSTDTAKPSFCMFEAVYFMRPDSGLNNTHGPRDLSKTISGIRLEFGRTLAREHPVKADLVAPIPDSGIFAAQGFAEESKIPYNMVYVRSHAGRSFIKPTPELRESIANFKLAVIPEMVRDKRVVIVDDSIIRGITSQLRVKELREAGAKEVHVRVSCPPTRHPCYYGIDFPTEKELVAQGKTVEEIKKEIGADTLGYLSLEGMHNSAKGAAPGFCNACWTGNYPSPREDLERELLTTKEVEN